MTGMARAFPLFCWPLKLAERVAAGAAAFVFGCALVSSASAEEDIMRFRSECFASFCFAIAEGRVDGAAAERFQEFWSGTDATYEILLHSQGGNLEAGMKLGRAIREAGLGTIVGTLGTILDGETDKACLSACAYAFLGGTTREIPEGNRIGFHQFALPGGGKLQGAAVFSAAQSVSAQILAYIVEMNVDARLFVGASSKTGDDMFFPDEAQLYEYDVATPSGFDHFILEPYGDGVIAASKRVDATGFRDLVTHLTAYCMDGSKKLLLTADGAHGIESGMDYDEAGLRLGGIDTPPILFGRERVTMWDSDGVGYVSLELTSKEVERLLRADGFVAFFNTTGAAGGSYSASPRFNDMDKKMLEAAFRFCI